MESLNEQVDKIREAFYKVMTINTPMGGDMPINGYVEDVFPDYIIAEVDDKYYQINYSASVDGYTFDARDQWKEVVEAWVAKTLGKSVSELKRGARNNNKDMSRLQTIHDLSVANGAMCQTSEGKQIEVDEVIAFGNAVKAVQLDDGSVKLGGYLVTYGNKDATDLTGDFFVEGTDYGDAISSDVYFNHRLPVRAGGATIDYKAKLSKATLTKDAVGIFAETIITARNEYEKAIVAAGLAGKLGWSSGTAGHLVEREAVGKAWQIKTWILGLDASLTPTPAEPRNTVTSLKSLIPSQAALPDTDATQTEVKIDKESIMEKDEIKAMLDSNNEAMKAIATEAATKAVTDVLDKLPEVKARLSGHVEVTVDEGDRPFKNLGENLAAIAGFAKSGKVHPRIGALKAMEYKAALGSNEAIPSQGEFLLEPTITSTLLQNIHDAGVFSQSVQKLPVGPNSNSGWIPGVDETSRATGSRWGGVRGYHAAEAASMTASQPKFRKINWELHKTYVLQYASDELLNDVGLMNAIIQKSSMEELDYLCNYDLLLGIGGDRPVGVMNSGALISVARAATTAIAHADIVSMWARMLPRNKANAKWYISSDVHAQLDQLTFTSGSTGILSPYIGYRPDGVMTIYGKPVVETEFNPALGTAGDILLADMGEYLFWEKNAIEAASSIHVQFLTDQTAFRFVYRYDGQTALASAITPANGGATQSPFIALLATT
jgi:HK97 family phage major capsid protein